MAIVIGQEAMAALVKGTGEGKEVTVGDDSGESVGSTTENGVRVGISEGFSKSVDVAEVVHATRTYNDTTAVSERAGEFIVSLLI